MSAEEMNLGLGTTVSLPEPPTGWFDCCYAALMDGTLAIVRTNLNFSDFHAAFEERIARARRTGVDQPIQLQTWARFSTFDGTAESEAIEVPLGTWPLIVDRLVDGRWLIVVAFEDNARLYASDGTHAGACAIGFCVQHVRCAPDGTIWVGYNDQGVFGNGPPSRSGIARFTPDGAMSWGFNIEERGLFIADCYALTLNGNTAWSCFYQDFPIVRIERGEVRHWLNDDIRGATALAIDSDDVFGDHVLLAGGYRDEAGRIALLRLEDDRARHLGELRFQPPPHGAARLIQGQGATLHIVGQGRWSRITVSTACALLGA